MSRACGGHMAASPTLAWARGAFAARAAQWGRRRRDVKKVRRGGINRGARPSRKVSARANAAVVDTSSARGRARRTNTLTRASALDTARMSPAAVPRRGTAQAPASASDSHGSRAGRELAAAAGVALLAAGFAAVSRLGVGNPTSNPGRRASSPPRRVAGAVQPRPGGVIAFEAAAPVAAAEHAWPAARAAALGELNPGVELTDVLEQTVLERRKNSAVVKQAARWRVGPASGVAVVTVRSRVDDARTTAAFELVRGDLDASEERTFESRGETRRKKTSAPRLAAYDGVLGVENGAVVARGAAVLAPLPGPARALAARFAARVLRKQIMRTVADVAAVADARARETRGARTR